MTDKLSSTDQKVHGVEPPAVYLSQTMLSKLAEAGIVIPKGIQVMLALASNAGLDGTIKVSETEVAEKCSITPKLARAAILGLAGAGLIESLKLSSRMGGDLSCRVNSDHVGCNRPKDI